MRRGSAALCAVAAAWAHAASAAPDIAGLAAKFGARRGVIDASISPDGKRVALLVPGKGRVTELLVAGADGKDGHAISRSDGAPFSYTSCGWASPDRLVCDSAGVAEGQGILLGFTRLYALDADGKHAISLSRRVGNGDAARLTQFNGDVIDWRQGDGSVLMERDFVPAQFSKSNITQSGSGLGVELVDTRTGNGRTIERPRPDAQFYLSDGRGNVRVTARGVTGANDQLTGTTAYFYRPANGAEWRPFSRNAFEGGELRPVAVDADLNAAYALKREAGRDALYRVSLDGTMRSERVLANPEVDIDRVETIGRGSRVIGASYVTDRRSVSYFDPSYAALATALGKAIPALPLVRFVDATADERTLLILAASDIDPGRYYVFDRTNRKLAELALARPELEGVTLSPVRSISYVAGDGTAIPGYLTMPPSGPQKNIPAIVMPHGGPAARDEWGFDWLAQFFAQAGFAVLQPNYRGSTGYGEAWYMRNGFKSWRTAIGDVAAAGRWLIAQGIADPSKLAIVGWSYGGYAALQAQVLDPGLFKATVAIAPVTDLGMAKEEARFFTNFRVTADAIGSGPTIADASPARNARAFGAPVLMFHGDQDLNVGIAESRAMDAALRGAGKASRLVVYPGLDHQLEDSTARADMLVQSADFLRRTLKIE